MADVRIIAKRLEAEVHELDCVIQQMEWEIKTARSADLGDRISDSMYEALDRNYERYDSLIRRLEAIWEEDETAVDESFAEAFKEWKMIKDAQEYVLDLA